MNASNIPAVQTIADQVGVSYADALGFLAGVQVWVGKGMTFEAAVAKHMQVMREGCALALERPRL
jgi:hypothetical protein